MEIFDIKDEGAFELYEWEQSDPFFPAEYADLDYIDGTHHAPIFVVTLGEDRADCGSEQVSSGEQPAKAEEVATALSLTSRKAKIDRYLQKRARRCYAKKVAYQCRKTVADNRIRVKGRFVTKRQEVTIRTASARTNPAV